MPESKAPVPQDLSEVPWEPGTPSHTAEFFCLHHDRRPPVKYVENIGWHMWDGKVWQPDSEGLGCRALLKDFITVLNVQSFGQSWNKRYTLDNAYLNNVMGPLQLTTLTAPKWMDADPTVLNCQNGVLDLTTFELTPHDQSLNMTMITEADYTGVIDPLWTSFVKEILPDKETREYLQRLVGLSLLGEVLLHTLPILQGSGSNGKSTLMDAVTDALGSYARVAESTLLMTGAGDAQSASPATLMLRGKRLVITSETEEGKKLASAFVKQITGGDKLTARALHKMPVTWKPTHSVFLLTNPMPIVDGSDQALFRRLKVIPFKQKFEKDQMDEELPRKLRLLWSSVLSWAIEGLKDYQANGIQEPGVVTGATDEYRGENDALSTFMAEYLEFGPGTVTVPALSNLLHTYQQDVDPRNRITSQKLNRVLREHNAVQGRVRIEGKPTSVWNGVYLKPTTSEEGIDEL